MIHQSKFIFIKINKSLKFKKKLNRYWSDFDLNCLNSKYHYEICNTDIECSSKLGLKCIGSVCECDLSEKYSFLEVF